MIERSEITYMLLVGKIELSAYRPWPGTVVRIQVRTKTGGVSRDVPIQALWSAKLTTSALMRFAVLDELGIAEHKEDAPLVAFLKEAEELLNEKEVCDFINYAEAELIRDVAYSKEEA